MHHRTAFSLGIVLAFAMLLVCAAKVSAASCPSLGSVSSRDGHLYVARIFAATPYSGAADAVFYTATAEYAAHIASLSVATADKTSGFRSETLAFLNPATEPFEAVEITFAQTDAADRCIAHLRIDVPSKSDDAQEKAVRDGLDPAATPIAPYKVLGSGSANSCLKPYAHAKVDGYPMQPQYPVIARSMGATGMSAVRVALNADGSVAGASIYKSSGFDSLDQAALQAALATHYKPEIFRCEPIAGAYIFRAEFAVRQ
jgi:TonB family protein